MASTSTATATAPSDAGEGPVMGLINRRLRALRKKLKRITQMEESISQGKTLDNDQQELLGSKPSVLVLIEELDKLHAPLSAAVSEEIILATTHHHAADATEEEAEKLEDLVSLLYFGSLFHVKSQSELTRKTHERDCCLVSTGLVCDKDLDLISELCTLMVSRPADSFLSHKNALERCVEHAKLWLANSDLPIASNCNVSYAGLREKLKKITGSNYFTFTPEAMSTAGNYSGVQVATDNEHKEEDASTSKEQESAVNDQSEQPTRQAPPRRIIDKGKGKLIESSSGIYKDQPFTLPASSASSKTVGQKTQDARNKVAGDVILGRGPKILPSLGKSSANFQSTHNSFDTIALWDKDNAPLPFHFPLSELRKCVEDTLKTHDDRLVLGRLIAYGPNLNTQHLRRNGIESVNIPRENFPCQVRVSGNCLRLIVKQEKSKLVKVMRCTDIADKYMITEVCRQMLMDCRKRVLIIAGDADYRTCIDGFKHGYFMLAQPEISSRKLHVSAKATWLWGSNDKYDMLLRGQTRYATASGHQSSR